jgi:hypothetical protein
MTDINRIWKIVNEHRDFLEEQWDEFHGTHQGG